VDYNLYKENLKSLNLKGSKLIKLIDGHRNNQTYWKRQNKVLKYIEIILKLLQDIPLEKRLVYLYGELKEV